MWHTKQAPGLPCFVHSSKKMGSLPDFPCAPFCQVIWNSVWQTAQSEDVCAGGGALCCAPATTSVIPAASRANTRAIKRRSIREVITYILLGSIFSAGIGASMKTLQEMH